MSIKDQIGTLNATAVNMGLTNIVADAPRFGATKSLGFNGVDEYIDIGTTAALQELFDGFHPFSISLWVKRANSGTQLTLLENIDLGPTYRGFQFVISNSTLSATVRDRPSLVMFNDLTGGNFFETRDDVPLTVADGWAHILVTYDGTGGLGVKYYRNSVANAVQVPANGLTLSASQANNINIARRGSTNSNFFGGWLMHLGVWDRVLVQDEVSAVYNAGMPSNPALLDSLPNLIHFNPLGNGDVPPLARDCLGTAVENTDGNMVNMDVTNVTTDVPLPFENSTALSFNSIDQWVDLGTGYNSLMDGTKPFSANFVMNYGGQSDSPILLSNRDSVTGIPGFQIFSSIGAGVEAIRVSLVHDNTVGDQILVKGSTLFSSAPQPVRQTVTVTYDGSGIAAGLKLYINGAAETMVTEIDALLPGPIITNAPLNIGRRKDQGQFFFGGLMDSLSIYDAELTPGQASELYNGNVVLDPRLSSPAAALVGWWPMGEGDTAPVLRDRVGGNDGVMINMNATNFVPETP